MAKGGRKPASLNTDEQNPQKKSKHPLLVYFDEEDWQWLVKYVAGKLNWPIADFIRMAIKNYRESYKLEIYEQDNKIKELRNQLEELNKQKEDINKQMEYIQMQIQLHENQKKESSKKDEESKKKKEKAVYLIRQKIVMEKKTGPRRLKEIYNSTDLFKKFTSSLLDMGISARFKELLEYAMNNYDQFMNLPSEVIVTHYDVKIIDEEAFEKYSSRYEESNQSENIQNNTSTEQVSNSVNSSISESDKGSVKESISDIEKKVENKIETTNSTARLAEPQIVCIIRTKIERDIKESGKTEWLKDLLINENRFKLYKYQFEGLGIKADFNKMFSDVANDYENFQNMPIEEFISKYEIEFSEKDFNPGYEYSVLKEICEQKLKNIFTNTMEPVNNSNNNLVNSSNNNNSIEENKVEKSEDKKDDKIEPSNTANNNSINPSPVDTDTKLDHWMSDDNNNEMKERPSKENNTNQSKENGSNEDGKDGLSRKKFNTIDEALNFLNNKEVELLEEEPWEPFPNNPHLYNFRPKKWIDELPEETRKSLDEYFEIRQDKESYFTYLTAYIINPPKENTTNQSNESNTLNENTAEGNEIDISKETFQDEERGKVVFNPNIDNDSSNERLVVIENKGKDQEREEKDSENVFDLGEIINEIERELKVKVWEEKILPEREKELAMMDKDHKYHCLVIGKPYQQLTLKEREFLKNKYKAIPFSGENNTTEIYLRQRKESISEKFKEVN